MVAGWKHLVQDAAKKMKTLKVPMAVIIGEEDKNTRMDRAKSLLKAGVKLNVVSAIDGGELLVFTHPKLIIDTVLAGHQGLGTNVSVCDHGLLGSGP